MAKYEILITDTDTGEETTILTDGYYLGFLEENGFVNDMYDNLTIDEIEALDEQFIATIETDYSEDFATEE